MSGRHRRLPAATAVLLVLVATHTGLFRAAEGERRARRVAGRFQDTMGFTVIGPNRFLGSGHPICATSCRPSWG